MKTKVILLTLLICIFSSTNVFADDIAVPVDSSDWDMYGMKGNFRYNYTKQPTIFTDISSENYAVLSEDNSLYVWGMNNDGVVGNGQGYVSYFDAKSRAWIYPFVSEPYKILDNVKYYSGQTWAIKNDNSLWVWGPTSVALGLSSDAPKTTPQKYMDDVISFAVGVNEDGDKNFFVVKTDGTLLGWGKNTYGELGDGTTEERKYATYIMSDVVSVQCFQGKNGVAPITLPGCTYAIRADGSLWWWGASAGKMRYVNSTSKNAYYQTTPVRLLEDINTVNSYMGSFAAITNDGDLYVWGVVPRNIEGALQYTMGMSSNVGSSSWTGYYSLTPYLLQKNVKEVHIYPGQGSNFGYITENGDVYFWGFLESTVMIIRK